MQVSQAQGEHPIQIYDDLDFVNKQNVGPNESHNWAYQIEGPRNYVLAVDAGTLVAPHFYNVNGEPVDDSAVLLMQKADRQGNPLGNAIVFEDTFDVFDYEKMRSDTDYFRTTHKPLVLDEKEFLNIYVDLPSGSADFDADASRLTIGDKSTRKNQPAFIRRKDELNGMQQQAVENGGN